MRSCFESPAARRFCSDGKTAGDFKTASDLESSVFRDGIPKVRLDERGRNGLT